MANRTYEVMYIVNPDTPVETIGKLNEAVGKLVEKEGGSVVRMGVLQRIAICYLIASFIFILTDWRQQLIISFGSLIVYWALMLEISPDPDATISE